MTSLMHIELRPANTSSDTTTDELPGFRLPGQQALV